MGPDVLVTAVIIAVPVGFVLLVLRIARRHGGRKEWKPKDSV